MLTLVTGAPGAGKTLWTMREVEKLRRETQRPVYYNGISGVTLAEWKELSDEEARHSHALPQGAIIVVDEVYRLWPQSKPGNALPQDVELFATHRHRGHDFFLLVQDRQRLHHFIRGLVGRHVHFERQFGLNRSRGYEWQKLGDPKDNWSKKDAAGFEFIFPRDVFAWYKSADLHTVKKRLPWERLALIPLLCSVIAGLLWHTASRFTAPETTDLDSSTETTNPVESYHHDPASEGIQWASQWEERVKGQPHSASFYDPTLKPAAMPKISGCLELITENRYSCKCNTQQGTIISTLTVRECRFYLANGWFDPTKPDESESPSDSRLTSAGAGFGDFASSPEAAAPPLDAAPL